MKEYQGEKAIISLTSWKARINSVSKTIFSIIKLNKNFHIVLVLSEDEFTNKEDELPEDLQLLIKNNVIELLWVKQNTKSFKKLFPTQAKYPDVPIIVADDGLIYKRNFAEILYNAWSADNKSIYTTSIYNKFGIKWGCGGWGIIFPPGCFNKYYPACLTDEIIASNHDDALYGVLASKAHINYKKAPLDWTGVASETDDGIKSSMCRKKCYTDNCIPMMQKSLGKIL